MGETSAINHPLIGITAGRKALETNNRLMEYFTMPVVYAEAVLAAGGLPVILPPTEGWHEGVRARLAPDLLARVDGFLITGGEDIDPAHYGQARHETVEKVDPLRDEFEIAVARFALAEDRPLLGICRGSQVINVAAGGALIQDLPSQQPGPVSHWQPDMKPAHGVEIAPGSCLLAALGASRLRVNSCHHQAVQSVAPPLRPVAWAEDGVIEAAESPMHHWIVAVQWHPEMLYENDPTHRRLFEALVEAAKSVR